MRALVTGCGRRLGFYLCEQLVAAGWQVTGSYRSERAELAHLRALGVELVQADFAVEGEVARLATALGAHDDLALIIHNASAFEPQATDPAAQLAQFEQFYRVHMAAPFQLNRALGDFVQRLQHFERLLRAGLEAVNLELLEAVRNRDLQPGLNRADVRIHRAAQIGHAGVVRRREGVAKNQGGVFPEKKGENAVKNGTKNGESCRLSA